MSYTGHVDTFVRDHLPPPSEWPELIFDLPELAYPERLNCATELLDKVAAVQADMPCLRSPELTWTYGQLLEYANRIAHVLREEMGLVPGNRVLLRAPNQPLLVAAWYGVLKAGGVVVATMPLLRAKELSEIVTKAQISHALCDDRLMGELEEIKPKCPSLQRIVAWGDLVRLMRGKPPFFENVETASDDPALIAFTSGTTGKPKGCVHFHRDVLAVCDTFGKYILRALPDDVFIGSPSIAFTYGLGGLVLFPMRIGAQTVLLERGSPDLLLPAIAEFGATVVFSSPTAYRAMALQAKSGGVGRTRMRKCVSAGEPLPVSTREHWKARFGVEIIDGIGSTEMLHIFISHTEEQVKPGAIGTPVPGYVACVLDEEGKPLPPGRVGRLAVKGPTGCRYLADERQTEYVQNGWNITGDAASLDEESYYSYYGRLDDLIVSAGYNIAPLEVEETLLQHPAVAECAVIGVPDPERGQIVKAYVVLKQDVAPSEELAEQLKEYVKQRIAPYKYPRSIEFRQDLPRTPTGKIQRFVLRQEAQRSG